jgi:alpha/beta superfamily hydrolase
MFETPHDGTAHMKFVTSAVAVGAIGIACCLAGCGKRDSSAATAPDGAMPQPAGLRPNGPDGGPPRGEPDADLMTARRGFKTRVVANKNYEADGPVDQPPRKYFSIVQYPSAVGPLAAYLSPDPGDGKKHPALVYAHGGFGGINGINFGREEFAPFRDAGYVLFCPSWRGENVNKGQYEMFYGEVDDAVAAVNYLAKQPYVDPSRIYMLGHSTGGTVTLLAAEANAPLRAAFSFGGAPDVAQAEYGNTPFDREAENEVRLRSAIHFVKPLKVPTFYFEGDTNPNGTPSSGYLPAARRMQALADEANAPFKMYVVKGGTHFNIVQPVSTLLVDKLRADTGEKFDVTITAAEVNKAFASSPRRK